MDLRKLLDPKTGPDDARRMLSSLRFGDAKKALANLRLLMEGVEDPLLLGLMPGLVRACAASADPDGCLNNFERVSGAAQGREEFLSILSWHPESVKLLAPVLASSRFLTTFLMGDPEGLLGWLFSPGRLDGPASREDMVREAAALCPADTHAKDAMGRLRRFKYREFLRITVRDLLGRADIPETTLELSNLADAALEAAIRVASAELEARYGTPLYETPDGGMERCPFTVIAMGKHGGRELNFSSDIDIMYLYLTDKGETSGPSVLPNHQFFVKLGELITRIIGESTEDGIVFRVDTRLRPEGERGDLAQCLSGYEIYYESWGQTWERSALIKARPCAGDAGLGRAFTGMIRPFVYRKYLDFASIGEIREMKQRVEKAAAARAARGADEIDLKLGAGGIREIEFFISSLQLIYGGREAALRERNSLMALHRLALKDLVSFEEQQDLSRAYVFLRTAEHRLQLVDERQTHSLSPEPDELRALALRMGYRDGRGISAAEAFHGDYGRHAQRVREIYDGLFEEQPVDSIEIKNELELLLSMDVTEEEAAGLLAKEGFKNPGRAYRNVVLLRDGSPEFPITPRTRNLFVHILPALISGCSNSPDPDMALNNLESFITSFGSRQAVYALINERPSAAGLITRLFGSSEYFSRLLIAHPEMSDTLLTGEEPLEKGRPDMASELYNWLSGADGFAGGMDLLRRFKHSEEIRIGMRDLFLNPGYRAVSAALTTLAEVVLDGALRMAFEDMKARYGTPEKISRGGGVAVIGLGKLGGRELIYGSDLDIYFIHEKAGKSSGPVPVSGTEFFSRLAERVIFALSSLTREGFVFRVDTRLRPGGSKGVLAHRPESLEKYYRRTASVWEFQALTRARPVAGDGHLCSWFEGFRKDMLSVRREPAEVAGEIRSMRARMERELGGKTKAGTNIKQGKGGIVDVEFAVQYLQLAHGPDVPDILVPDTATALDIIADAGLVAGNDGRVLKEAYGFYRELESKIRITTGQPDSVLPDEKSKLAVLAARMGYGGREEGAGGKLLADFTEHAARVRGVFERVLGEGG